MCKGKIMNKFKHVFIAAAFCCLLFITVFAACKEPAPEGDKPEVIPPKVETADGYFKYTDYGDDAYAIAAFNKDIEGEIHIPSTYNDKKIVAIEANGFSDCKLLSAVELGENIVSVGDNAFSGCEKLEKAVMPRTVKSVGYNAFSACINLCEVRFGGNVKDWLDISFYHNRTPDYANPLVAAVSAKTEGSGKLYLDNELVSSVTLPESVEVINGYAFAGCSTLESVTIPETVTLIRARAFENCASLKQVVFGASVREIGSFAFYGCTQITELIIPDSVGKIGAYAFCECTGLKAFTLPKSVTKIDNSGLLFNAELEKFYYTGTSEDWSLMSLGISAVQEELDITYLD